MNTPFRCFLALLASGLLALAGCSSESPSRSARVAARQLMGEPVTVYAAGDIADCRRIAPNYSGAARTAELIEAGLEQDADAAVLALGDNSYPVGLLAEFAECYGPTWGRFKDRTYPSPGNHEYYSPQAAGYYRYFGERAGPSRRGYYSFELGKWHVISLNSNLRGEEYQAQLAWVRQDLARNTALCTLAYWHHPLFSSGWHAGNPRMAELWDVLQQGGADVVLSGHDHIYERFAPQDSSGRRDDQGMRQFVVGTGGAEITPFLPRRAAHSEAGDNSTLGVLKLSLRDNGYQWQFLSVQTEGYTDQGAALCH